MTPSDKAPVATAPTARAAGSESRAPEPVDASEPTGRASFVDLLTGRIASLPLGGWWVYLAVLLASAAWATVVRWKTGVASFGSLDPKVVTFTVFLPYGIALVHYLDLRAERAFAIFAPALGGSEREIASWRRELTSLPPRPAAAAALCGALFGGAILAGTPPSIYRLFSSDLPTTALLVGWLIVLSFGAMGIVLYHTWHQLRAVRAIHAVAARIDLFRPAPLFAFSALTAQTGLGYLLLLYYGLTINGEFTTAGTPALAIDVVLLVPTAACFLLPLIGMHGRLIDAKAALLAESDLRLDSAKRELYRRVDAANLAGVGDVKDALEGLTVVRDQIVRLPTWPWSPRLFGGFVTALFLPIVIWFITRALGGILKV